MDHVTCCSDHVTALDSDQSSYKQSDDEESDQETDVEDIEFSGILSFSLHPSLFSHIHSSHPHTLTNLSLHSGEEETTENGSCHDPWGRSAPSPL